ncbi:PREDICTED: uncharacterized protein LOC109233241 [Nicotiana attenuata]|uniref:uncharacterized protein LOC109233241 n=1 Tax=Nicotiana attenuata TaxID=49451 RepID=UPI000904E38F|nr:PREDICTED: uncharacterized protein LOC109233241 [Nicotiana attenuata]
MECVTSVSYSLLLNGGLTAKFQARKGLRQRDPMSPYLFVLVMEYLNRSLKTLDQIPDFNYHPRCAKLKIIHICFADDLIMCCRADRVSIQLMLKAFHHFSEVSGLQANMEKSSFYVAGVTEEFKNLILSEMHFTLGEFPFKYLGVPLSTKKLTIAQCMPLVEKITARIKCWTTKFLSYSGRLQVIKSVLFEMQTYWAQVFLIPKKIIHMVTIACRTFLWTGSTEISKRSLVAWEKLCMPGSAGGLGILDFYSWNKAALCKILWAISTKKDILWVKWIHNFYIKNRNISTMATPKQACWIVRKVFDTREWFEAISATGDINEFWKQGKFSIKTMYTASRPQYHKVTWKNLMLGDTTIPRHRFILWLALNHRLATVDRLAKWKIDVPNECVLCTSQKEETLDHLFFECVYTKSIWTALLGWLKEKHSVGSWELELKWLTKRTKSSRPRAQVITFLFAATVYYTWMERNNRRFQNQFVTYADRVREIALQLHIKGQNRSKWKAVLEQLNRYPSGNSV